MRYKAFVFTLFLILFLSACFAHAESNVGIQPEELGLSPVLTRCSGDCAAVSMDQDEVIFLTPQHAGEMMLTVYNNYSETATVDVAVSEDGTLTYTCHPFEAPSASVNVVDFGAIPNDGKEDTAAIQRAIDSLAEGGTVYIPAGEYSIAYLEFRQGIHLRLAGCLPDACTGYTEEVGSWVKSGNVAVLRTNYKSAHMFYNLKRGSYCTEGVGDFSLSGGVLYCGNRTMAFVWACADGVVLENCIIKDGPNNHAIQIDGCSNVVIRNVMFAGYQYSSVKTRETIQIEPTTQTSINSDYDTSPVKCKNGDFHFNSNIRITGCYFGKSDVSGPQLTPLGHHVVTGGKTVCDGLEFSNNVVDNPLLYGLHLLNYANVQVYGNTFISNEELKPLARDTALIFIDTISKDGSYEAQNGVTVNYACANEVEASKHVDIHDNRFILGASTPLRALYINGSFFTPGASVVRDLYRADFYGAEPYPYSGYLINHNYLEDVRFCNNEIIVEGGTRYSDHPVFVNFVYDFTCTGNNLTSDTDYRSVSELNGETVPGLMASMVKNGKDVKIVLEGKAAAEYGIYLADTAGAKTAFPCLQNATLSVPASEGGQVTLYTLKDGSVVLQPVPNDGYLFAGWQDESGASVDPSQGFAENLLLSAQFNMQ